MVNKRETAYYVKNEDVLKSEYITDSNSNSNYFLINNKKVSRVNIIGVITYIEDKLIIFDDGSGELMLRDFNDVNKDTLATGNLILIVGRPREYNNEKYIVPEIIKKINNPKWIEYRKIIINKENQNQNYKTETKQEVTVILEKNEIKGNDVKNIISLNDKGDGVSMKIILEKIDSVDCEKEIKNLLKMGEIYEIKPGIFKLL